MSICDQRFQRLDSESARGRAREAPHAPRLSRTLDRDVKWFEIQKIYGFSCEQLAEFLNRPLATVKDGVRRAREAIGEGDSSRLTSRELGEIRAIYGESPDPEARAFARDPYRSMQRKG